MGFFLRLFWVDQRLAFDPFLVDGEVECDIAEALHNSLWTPDM